MKGFGVVNARNIKRITSYVTKYVTKNNEKFKCQIWNCSRKVSDFYISTEFTGQFKRLKAVTKEITNTDRKSPVIDDKMIDLNRKTLPLCKRLDNVDNTVL